jgi:hypothetical protein
VPFPLHEQAILPVFPLASARSPPGFFQGRSSSNFFPAPCQVQKNGDQETLKHRPHKKEDDLVYREGGIPPFSMGNLSKVSPLSTFLHDLH